jgi:RNA polymerase sigma-70 factor (ECF subfamily)
MSVVGMRRGGASLDQLRQVYERRLNELRRVAAAIVRDRELACDVVQDAFVRAVRSRHTYGGDGSLEAWVWRIVVNTARDTRADVWEEIPDDSPAPSASDEWERRMVRAAVERLPERQRLVLFLRVYADLDYGTIARAVGISEGTVGATLNAAHNNLRHALSEVRS